MASFGPYGPHDVESTLSPDVGVNFDPGPDGVKPEKLTGQIFT